MGNSDWQYGEAEPILVSNKLNWLIERKEWVDALAEMWGMEDVQKGTIGQNRDEEK